MKKTLLLSILSLIFFWSSAQITVTETISNLYCNGDNSGFIELDVSSPMPPFIYNWEGPNGFTSYDEDIYGLEAGTYNVTITEMGGQVKSINEETYETFVVTEPLPLTINYTEFNNPSCSGDADGSITIEVNGGTQPYNLEWTIPDGAFFETTESIDNLIAETYNLFITDFNECEYSADTILQNPESIWAEPISMDISCYGANDGVIAISPGGGTPPYTYLWSNGATTETISGLSLSDPGMGYGEYFVTITDANNCIGYSGGMINEPYPVMIDLYTINSNCGNSDGEASVNSAEGGSGNFEYTWSTGAVGSMVYGLSAGIYSVEVKDIDYGCSYIKYFFIEDNTSATIEPIVIDATCPSCNDGQITLNITDGQAPYIIAWDNNMIGPLNANLYTGSYSATISDANGCLNTACVQVNNAWELGSSYNSTNTSGCGFSDGSAIVYPWNGTPPYTYFWDDPFNQITQTASGLSAGIYHCTISDILGYSIVKTIGVGDDGGPSINYESTMGTNCANDTGSVNINITGGSGTYNYLWSNGENTEDLANIPAGEYTVLVNDGACSSVSTFYVFSEGPQNQEICIVTVDSATNHNLIVWENTQTEGVDHYNIYRENCNEDFSLIGSVGATEITVFEDISSLPFLKSYAYKLSAVDACGNESNLSNIHKTIHLEINLNEATGEAQLIWDDYMGFPNPIFKIYKKEIGTGWNVLTELSNTEFSFTDIAYDYNTISYAVIVEKPNGESCDAWNGNAKASGGPYYQSVSNLEDEGIINHTNINKIDKTTLAVFPNPTNGILNIESNENVNSVRIYNTSGQLIRTFQSIHQNNIKINTQYLTQGVYLIEIDSNGEIFKQHIVVE